MLQASCDGTTDVEVAQAAANVPIYISSGRVHLDRYLRYLKFQKSSMIFHGFMIFMCTLDYLGIFGSLSFPTLETSWSTPPTSTFLPLVCIGQKGVQPKTSPRIFLSHFFLGCQSCQIFLHISSVFITFIIFKVMKSSWNLPPVRYHPLRLSWHPEGAQPREARPWRAHGEPMGRGAICGNAQKHRGNQRTFQWRNMTIHGYQ